MMMIMMTMMKMMMIIKYKIKDAPAWKVYLNGG